MTSNIAIGGPGVILLIGLIVFLIVLAVKGGKTGRIIAAVLAAFLVIMPGLMHFVTITRLAPRPAVPVTRIWPSDTTWDNIANAALEPDVYPSIRSAAVALACKMVKATGMSDSHQLAETYTEVIQSYSQKPATQTADKERSAPVVQVTAELDKSILAQIVTAVQNQNSGLNVQLADTSTAATRPAAITLTLKLNGEGSGSINDYTYKMKILQAELRSAAGVQTQTTNVVDKPWADDFTAFVNTNPGQHWLIACSPRPCLSSYEAENEALAQAALKLAPRVADQLRTQTPTWRFNLARREVETSDVVPVVQAALQTKGYLVADRFLQRFDRSYGDVWREVVLVKASPEDVRMLALQYRNGWAGQRAAWLKMIGSCAALMGLIYLIYLFLNAATRGYYAWSLRVAAVVLAGVVLFLLMTIA